MLKLLCTRLIICFSDDETVAYVLTSAIFNTNHFCVTLHVKSVINVFQLQAMKLNFVLREGFKRKRDRIREVNNYFNFA